MRRRRFLPFFPFAKPLALLDIRRTPTASRFTEFTEEDTGEINERFRSP
jgi:hypothetical protein